jgi:aldehyde:ferredoxin oxidoreductase
MLPGKDGELTSRLGAMLDRTEFDTMLSDYYRLRGWDTASGLQTGQCLQRLNLEYVIDELKRLKACID